MKYDIRECFDSSHLKLKYSFFYIENYLNKYLEMIF